MGYDNGLIDEREAAKLLGIAPITLKLWRLADRAPRHIKLGTRTIRYRREDVQAWISDRAHDPVAVGVADGALPQG